MATYPTTIPFHVDSKRITRDGRSEDVADSGAVYVRSFYSTDKFDFVLKHEAVSSTNMTTIQSFYDANKNLAVDLVWPEDGVTYTGLRFGAGGYRTEPNKQHPTRRDVYIRLVGTA